MMGTLLQLKGYDVVVCRKRSAGYRSCFDRVARLNAFGSRTAGAGLNVARNIRRNAKLQHVPIVIVSGHDPDKHRQAALDAGCTDYLTKPIDFDRLDSILAHNVPLEN